MTTQEDGVYSASSAEAETFSLAGQPPTEFSSEERALYVSRNHFTSFQIQDPAELSQREGWATGQFTPKSSNKYKLVLH